MKTLEVTDEQYAFIQHLRREISDQVVGKYGFVRERDAIQFLIDNLDGDLEVDDEFESTASDLPAVIPDATDDENAITYDENEGTVEVDPDDETDANEQDTDADDEDDDEESDADSEADEDESEGDAEEDDSEDDTGDASGEADDTSGDGDGTSDDADGGAADDDDMLDRMMSLLETHDDKWEESPSGDFRYRVTLPDGETEDVQTKDDVRALLFKNYR